MQEFIFRTDWCLENITTYNQYLCNKSVLLVGGSPQFDIKELNDYDVIIRINDHVIVQGGRCDVLYHTVRGLGLESYKLLFANIVPCFAWLNVVDGPWESGLNPKRMAQNYEKHFESNGCKVGYFAQGEWLFWNPYGPEHEWLNALHKRHNCKLLTGLVALAHIMRSKAKSITLTAMDLYTRINANENLPKSREGYRHSHFLPGQVSFLKEAKQDSRVRLPQQLIDAIGFYDAKFGPNYSKPIS